MTRTGITNAMQAAYTFLEAAYTFLEYAKRVEYLPAPKDAPHMAEYIASEPKLTGELRRASMELTRALAEMRRP